MNPEPASELARFAVALLVGLLIGLDRERSEVRKARDVFAGIRTFPLIALAGCAPMVLFETTGPWLVSALALGVGAITAIAYWRGAAAGHIGATTEIAALATFLLGALAGSGRLLAAGAVGVAVATLLVAKPKLEAVSKAMAQEEVAAVMELAVISVIVLPLLPDRGFGPWQALNPREIWLVVVLVAGLSFAGFLAVRLLGEGKGMMLTGAVGGLVSSTAVTVAMADRSKESKALSGMAAAAAVLASTVMAVRVVVLAAAINPGVVPRLAPVTAAMALTGLVAALLIARSERGQAATGGAAMTNPFSLRRAVLFALLYAVVVLGARGAQTLLGSGAMFATAAVASIADVDAVTIAFTRMGPGNPPWRDVAGAITLATVMNTLVKLVIAWTRGRDRFRRDTAIALGVMAAVGVVAGVVVYGMM